MNKATQYSIDRIKGAIEVIEALTPLEVRRISMDRKKKMENAYDTLSLHASKLKIALPGLSAWYKPEEYLGQAIFVSKKLQELTASQKDEETQ